MALSNRAKEEEIRRQKVRMRERYRIDNMCHHRKTDFTEHARYAWRRRARRWQSFISTQEHVGCRCPVSAFRMSTAFCLLLNGAKYDVARTKTLLLASVTLLFCSQLYPHENFFPHFRRLCVHATDDDLSLLLVRHTTGRVYLNSLEPVSYFRQVFYFFHGWLGKYGWILICFWQF